MIIFCFLAAQGGCEPQLASHAAANMKIGNDKAFLIPVIPHSLPCPAGINIGLVNKYYGLAQAGDNMAANHYEKVSVKPCARIGCGHCDRRCPFHTPQSKKMKEISAFFGA